MHDVAVWLLSALTFAIAMSATPGPNNAMVAASGANFGLRRTVPHIAGIALGFPLMILAVAAGAGALLHRMPWVIQALRWIGAAYLLWLAWHIATADPDPATGTARRRPFGFLQAAAFQWVNPKAWVIALSAIVTYTGVGRLDQAAALAVLFVVVTAPTLVLWAGLGVGAGRLLRTRRALRGFNQVMALLLVASLVPLLFES